MLRSFRRFDETRNEVRLDFFEPPESLLARLPELSGTRLPAGRGLLPWSSVTVEGDELRVTESGRRLVRGRVASQPQGCSLILESSAPVLKIAVYLWLFTAVCGIFFGVFPVLAAVLQGRFPFPKLAENFIYCSLVGSLVYPALWGRRWEFRRIAAALSERLQANNNSELQSVSQQSSLARRGAWSSVLSAFLWAPLIAINGSPLALAGKPTIPAPWENPSDFLVGALLVDFFYVPFVMLLIGWAFVGGGAACGHLTAKLLPSRIPRLRQWTTTLLAMTVSLWLNWLISGSQMIERMLDMP